MLVRTSYPDLRLVMQVVSDIDDTLMCSGGHYPAGRDMRYPHNCVYPGILAFYNELDVGHVQRSEIQVEPCSVLIATDADQYDIRNLHESGSDSSRPRLDTEQPAC